MRGWAGCKVSGLVKASQVQATLGDWVTGCWVLGAGCRVSWSGCIMQWADLSENE